MNSKLMVEKNTLKSRFKLGTNSHFMTLMSKFPDHLWDAKDVTLLAAKYPGVIFPEGMTWGLKQYGNLFCLLYIKGLELVNVLEVGAGFNLYFENKLPEHCHYTIIDDDGFYEKTIFTRAVELRERGDTVNGLLGKSSADLDDCSFDCCISVSVLEHVNFDDVDDFINDMYRVLKPGGWAVHSLDLSEINLNDIANKWLTSLKKRGFMLSNNEIDLDVDIKRLPGDELFIEPLSIVEHFYGGFIEKPWLSENRYRGSKRIHTVLFAVQKPEVISEATTVEKK